MLWSWTMFPGSSSTTRPSWRRSRDDLLCQAAIDADMILNLNNNPYFSGPYCKINHPYYKLECTLKSEDLVALDDHHACCSGRDGVEALACGRRHGAGRGGATTTPTAASSPLSTGSASSPLLPCFKYAASFGGEEARGETAPAASPQPRASSPFFTHATKRSLMWERPSVTRRPRATQPAVALVLPSATTLTTARFLLPADPLFLSSLGWIGCRAHRPMGAPFGRPPRLFIVGSVAAFMSSSRDLQVDPSSPSSFCCCSFAYLGWCSCACIFDVELGKLCFSFT